MLIMEMYVTLCMLACPILLYRRPVLLPWVAFQLLGYIIRAI